MGKGLKLVLDNIVFFLQHSGGGSVYWIEHIKRLDGQPLDIEYVEPAGETHNIFYRQVRPQLSHPIRKEYWGARILSFCLFRGRSDRKFVFHSSYYRVAASQKAINVVTIHDFMPELFFTGLKRFYHSYRKRRAVKKCDGIICVSDNTRNDLLRFYPEAILKPTVKISLGIADDYRRLAESEQLAAKWPNGYILFVGRRALYKNFDFAVEVLSSLQKYHLVVVGEGFSMDEKRCLEVLHDNFTLIQNPRNRELNKLYNGALCLLYPSSYEGFGIPVVEAMAAGCPVVALNSSSIPEISNGAALLLDNLSIADFVAAILKLESQPTKSDLISKGIENAKRFSWEKSTDDLLNFYNLMYSTFDK